MNLVAMQNFVLQTPSLKHLAGVKAVTRLWSQRGIFIQLAQTFNDRPARKLRQEAKEWQEIEDQVKSTVCALSLPETGKEQLLCFVKPIGMEIIDWCQYHHLDGHKFKFLHTLSAQHFCWSMHGTIDYAKTAEVILRDGGVDVGRRYEVACLNCLQNEAGELFKCIPKNRQQFYIREGYCWSGPMDHRVLMAYFTRTLSGDVDQLNVVLREGVSINQYLFNAVLARGTRATCVYFFDKLSHPEIEEVVEDYFMLAFRRTESPTCSLTYYLSMMNEEQQQDMFRQCAHYVLVILLGWPMQPLFMEAAKRGWQFLKRRACVQVLNDIVVKIRRGFRDYDYSQLFWACWSLSPTDYQQHFLNDVHRLKDLFATKEEDCIRLIFNRASSHHLKELAEKRYGKIKRVLLDKSVISNAALMECKETAALESSNEPQDEEKRLRNEYVGRLVDLVMEKRI